MFKRGDYVRSPFGVGKIWEIYESQDRVGIVTREEPQPRFCKISEIEEYKPNLSLLNKHVSTDGLKRHLESLGASSIVDALSIAKKIKD